jgi:hypothetical protein
MESHLILRQNVCADTHILIHTHIHTRTQHARATAVAATRLGMESHLILRQNDARLQEHVDPGVSGNLLIDRYCVRVSICVYACMCECLYVCRL